MFMLLGQESNVSHPVNLAVTLKACFVHRICLAEVRPAATCPEWEPSMGITTL